MSGSAMHASVFLTYEVHTMLYGTQGHYLVGLRIQDLL
jgi:hypothetical protein